MTQSCQGGNRQLTRISSLIAGVAIAIATQTAAFAQSNIAPDQTLGGEESIVTPNFNGQPTDLIQGGARRGQNLFHSFREFNVGDSRQVFFVLPVNDTVQNILARVTGNNRSEILGTLGTRQLDGTNLSPSSANLFLINPNGIIFGPSGRLSVGAAFVATTASAVQFGNQGVFSATNPTAPPLLTVNPSALLFNQLAQRPAAIEIDETQRPQFVPPGQGLFLVGGEVDIRGSRLIAEGGRIEIAAVANGTVGLITDSSTLRGLDIPGDFFGGAVRITGATTNSAAVNVSGFVNETVNNDALRNGGVFRVNAASISFDAPTDNAIALDARSESQGRGGTIELYATDNIFLRNTNLQIDSNREGQGAGSISMTAGNQILLTGKSTILSGDTYGAGSGGDINLIGKSIRFSDGVTLKTNAYGSGNGGTISLIARESLQIDASSISNVSVLGATGSGGNTYLQAGSIAIAQGSQISSETSGQGAAGNIVLNTGEQGSISILDSLITSDSRGGDGRGGDIHVQAGTFSLTDGVLSAATTGTGTAGNIRVTATRSAHVSSVNPDLTNLLRNFVAPGIFTSTIAAGQAGNLDVTVSNGSLQVQGGARISASTGGSGNGGALTVNASSVELSGKGVAADGQPSPSGLFTEARSTGASGNIVVNTQRLIVKDGAQISAETRNEGAGGSITVTANELEATTGGQLRTTTAGSGQAGNITTNITNRLTLTGAGTGLLANTEPGSTGNGGSIFIDPRTVTIREGARIAVSSEGSGTGGGIQIQAGRITLDTGGIISAETNSSQGGNITLNVQDLLLLRRGGTISATAGKAQGGGDGGNIAIAAPNGFIVAVAKENSDITANAFTGSGGNINITAQSIFGIQPRPRLTPLSDITASSEFGIQGVVIINTPDVDPNRGLVPLPVDLVDPSGLIAQGCTPTGKQASSSFVATGRGGLPPSPTSVLGGETVITRLATLRDRQLEQSIKVPVAPAVPPAAEIVEAQGWVVGTDGVVSLVAMPTVTPAAFWAGQPGLLSCGQR